MLKTYEIEFDYNDGIGEGNETTTVEAATYDEALAQLANVYGTITHVYYVSVDGVEVEVSNR